VGKSLVIVESPTKAKTIAGFLPRGFVVESSLGHIRDLPTSAKEIPPKLKKEPWARLGIDIARDFEPVYVVPSEKKKQVTKLKSLLKDASTLYLATDEDREGESISWHLVQVLQPRIPRKRLVFHEITREAIEEALENLRDIDERLVEAQETRRILDRLYGYEVSPVLWKKIAPKLSAGRVQSVAVRIIVERERERRRFVRSAYWDLLARFRTNAGAELEADLVSLGGKRIASGADFDRTTGKLKDAAGVVLLDEEKARDLRDRLLSPVERHRWTAAGVERKPFVWKPPPPFTTSTLQQEANRKLRLPSKETMRAAQRLYENGHITYMRTDSTTLSEQAVRNARKLIANRYGENYLSDGARQYQTKVKNAQEAHEAIRPAGAFRLPEEIRSEVSEVDLRVYELIWMRTIACQMAEARGQNLTIDVSDGDAVFRATGKSIEFPGYLRAYVEGADDPEAELADKEKLLPDVAAGEELECVHLEPKEHSTSPPQRYTEASLIKELEANGIGRPSTYATIIDTILRREYVVKQGNALVPTFMAFAVVGLLEKNFEDLVDIQFTARMEDDLDAISLGDQKSLPYLKAFYFGNGDKKGLKSLIGGEIDAREACTLPLGKGKDGRQINVRIGRYGPYLERGKERASIPAAMAPDELTLEKAEELLEKGSGPRKVGDDPATGKPVYVKTGRFGPYAQLGEKDDEPKMKSLLPGMDPEAVTLEEVLRVLSLPRSLGTDPDTGEEVLADYGRFGAYIRRGKETRSIPKTENLFDTTLERARELLREEKKGRRRGPAAVLKDLGPHPDFKDPIRLLDGRYGPYVSDGTTNASIPRGTEPNEVTIEQAAAWLKERLASGPPRRGRKPGGRQTARAKKKAPEAPEAATAEATGEAAASSRATRPAKRQKRTAARPAKAGAARKAKTGSPAAAR
jgi:DNA topoisomerase-1